MSTLGSLLLSIQSLMNEKPYFNEPGLKKVQLFITSLFKSYNLKKYIRFVVKSYGYKCKN